MQKHFFFWRWRWQGVHLATRHAIILAMLGVILAGSALSSSFLGAFAHSPCASGDRSYSVFWGDTLSRIASRYHTTWQRLASYNHLYNPNLIYPGQVVCIPSQTHGSSGSGSSSSGSPLSHKINQESGFNPYAISSAGAIGIAQFMPGTAASLGINPRDPVAALRGAARLMSQYIRQYGGNYAKALAAYNAGPGTVSFAVFLGGGNWQAYLPYETKNYIRVILG